MAGASQRAFIVSILLVGLFIAPARAFLVQGGGGAYATGRPLSRSVFASWGSYWSSTHSTSVTLMVLWRGTPGWFSRGGRSSSRGGGGGATAYAEYTFGDYSFRLDIDHAKRIVTILNREISLTENNVVLVDGLDDPAGPTVIGSRWIEPPSADQAPTQDAIVETVKRSPDLYEFLRCDLEQTVNPFGSRFCDQVRP